MIRLDNRFVYKDGTKYFLTEITNVGEWKKMSETERKNAGKKNVTGKVYIKLSPYRFELEGISSNNDLMNNSLGVYGEMNNGWSSNDVKGFIKIISNTGKIFNLKNSNKK